MNIPTREEAAWVGGLFEGEGCFTIHHRGDARKPNGVSQLAMTDQDTVERLAEIVGVGVVREKKTPEGHKDAFVWTIHGFEANQAFVAFIWPWLGKRRKSRAAEMLSVINAQRVRRRRCPHLGLQRTASGNCSACQLESYHRLRGGERVYARTQ